MSITGRLRQMIGTLMPWQPRPQRKAAIARARAGRGEAELRAEAAAAVTRDIRRIVGDNHFAARGMEIFRDGTQRREVR